MRRVATAWLPALLAVPGLAQSSPALSSPAQPRSAQPRSDGEVFVVEVVSVTGMLHADESLEGGRGALEIHSDLGGRYRIDVNGVGAALRDHVGERVTVVAFVEPYDGPGHPLLWVERFTLYAS